MKIIGGEFKGRRIEIPKGVDIRPTSDKVREALFNIIKDQVGEASVLDLFAGSGSLGIEALSRGAKKAVFIDIQRKCIDSIKRNLKNLPLSAKVEVYQNDAFKAIKKLSDLKLRFDIILLDPPYYDNILKKSLLYICNYDILNHSNLVVCEHFKKDIMPDRLECLSKRRQVRYGDTLLSFYARGEDEKSSISGDI